jgi:hypothetical protein
MMAEAMTLDALVDRARHHKMTPAEKRSQRVSLIMGLRGAESAITREKIEEIIDDVEGHDGKIESR